MILLSFRETLFCCTQQATSQRLENFSPLPRGSFLYTMHTFASSGPSERKTLNLCENLPSTGSELSICHRHRFATFSMKRRSIVREHVLVGNSSYVWKIPLRLVSRLMKSENNLANELGMFSHIHIFQSSCGLVISSNDDDDLSPCAQWVENDTHGIFTFFQFFFIFTQNIEFSHTSYTRDIVH